jgi:hypothetical protein
MEVAEHSRCLHESEPFARLNRQLTFLRKYWYAIAIAPFAVTIFVLLRFYGTSTNRLLDVPIGVALGWAFLVVIYSLVVTVRVLFVRCPKCGWRFGGGEKCGSCGFPRQPPSSLSGISV